MIGERHPEEPWEPRALGWLATVAGLRLELALTRKRLQTGPPDPPRPVASPAEPRTPTAPEPTALAPVAQPETPDPQLEAARRYARLVATDIRLYNEDAVVLGRRHRDLVERLAEPMGRGKESFLERHGNLGAAAVTLLRDAYVEVLAGGDAELLPDSMFE